jgi:hypothetical protein
MRPPWVFLAVAACHGPPSPADAGRKVVPLVEPEPEDAAAPEAEARAALRDVDGGPYRRAKDGSALLCDTHTVWRPPAGFDVAKVGSGVVARKGDRLVGVVYPAHADASYATAVAPFVEGTLAWDAPAMKRVDVWHAESTAYGRGAGLVAVARTLYAGVDPKTGKGRAGRSITRSSVDVVWIALAPTQKDADALLDAARASERMLVDHACECGYDCSHRR